MLGLNFTKPEEQPAPVVQGRTSEESQKLVETAVLWGFQAMVAVDGASVVRDNLPQPNLLSLLVQGDVDKLLDGQQRFTPGLERKYAPSQAEAPTGADTFGAFMGASYTAQQQFKGFEIAR